MPKKRPEPFWRSERSCWFVQIGKKQRRLDPDETQAWRLYHELMARPPGEPAKAVEATPESVVEILDAFLGWCRQHRAARTFAWYRENIQRLVDRIPPSLTAAEMKPYHVTKAMADFPHWANNTKNDFIGAVKRAFNWAESEGLVDRSPIARMPKPSREAREQALSPGQYAEVMAIVAEPRFRDLLEMAWETGARAQELQKIEASHVDAELGRIVLPPSKAKGKKHHRVIYLNERAREIALRLIASRPEGVLLVNSDEKPWNKNAINSAFCRLEKKLGVKHHLGSFRKGFATEALKAGVDVIGLAHLLGHRDPSMLGRVYAKVQQDPEYMAGLMEKAKRVKAAGDIST